MALKEHQLSKERKPTFGIGLLKGLAVTLKHLFKHNAVIEYPDEKQDLPARTRGVIALKEENCTVCMLCARECPDWCIYIDSHKETLPPRRPGGRPRKRNVLDRFAIDYALCMYCGICVEVCPYDALFWSREFEYAEYDIRQLTHEKEKLSDWMATVLPPPPLEDGAQLPGQPAAAAPAAAAAGAPAVTVGPTGARPATTTSSAAEARPQQAAVAPKEGTFATEAARPVESLPAEQQAPETRPERAVAEPARDLEAEVKAAQGLPGAAVQPEPEVEVGAEGTVASAEPAPATPQVAPEATRGRPGEPVEGVPSSAAAEPARTRTEPIAAGPQPPEERPPVATDAGLRPVPAEELEKVYQQVLKEQLEKGASPQVAEARAKVARVKAERGVRRGPTPVQTDKLVPSAPVGHRPEPVPGGAPEPRGPKPEPGPVAPTGGEQAEAKVEQHVTGVEAPPAEEQAAAERQAPAPTEAGGSGEDPDAVYERVLQEERAQGASDAVAVARAKAARMRAMKGTKGPGS